MKWIQLNIYKQPNPLLLASPYFDIFIIIAGLILSLLYILQSSYATFCKYIVS